MNAISKALLDVGTDLGFVTKAEVQASESAYVDVVWFDKRLPFPSGKKHWNMRSAPLLPIVGFEVELGTGLNAKHVKGSVTNLSNLNAQLGVIVIGSQNVQTLKNQPAHQKEALENVKETLRDRIYGWVYAEAQPKCRIVVMFEDDLKAWWGDRIPEPEAAGSSALAAAAKAGS
jgi:hypothetical protein